MISTFFEKLFAGRRDENIVVGFQKFLNDEKTGLDAGCGNGRLSKKLQEQLHLAVVGVDVVKSKNSKIDVHVFDGQKLPFADNSFDSVFLIDVLHHTENAEVLLKDAFRVAKKSVLIKDHYYENRFDLLVLKIADYFGNFLSNVHTPFYFKSKKEWENLLQSFDCRSLEWRSMIFPLITFPQIIYKISKKNPSIFKLSISKSKAF